MLFIMVITLVMQMDKLLLLMKSLGIKILNMLVNIYVSFGIVILLMGGQLLILILKNMIKMHFPTSKRKHGIGLIVIHKFVNTLLIFASAKIEIVVNLHELLISMNFYHQTMAFFLLLYKDRISIFLIYFMHWNILMISFLVMINIAQVFHLRCIMNLYAKGVA